MTWLLNLLWGVFVVFMIGYIFGAGMEYGRNHTWRALNRRGKSADPGSE